VAASDLAIVIEGETGAGKEGIARATHLWSGRTGPFIAVNCAALPEALAEGELFGYRKGAFTSADRANRGFFQTADGGTIFLDEVADLSLSTQAKLLRVLEQKEVTPLGEARPVPIDVRVVVATQTPLAALVEAKRFRNDLMARLNGLRVRLPPLRDRVEEVPYLFTRLLKAKSAGKNVPGLDALLVEKLCCHRWPLNIRELNNLVQRVIAIHGQEPILKQSHVVPLMDDPEPSGGASETLSRSSAPVGLSRAELDERQQIVDALERCAGSQTAAARMLNMARGTLVERLKRYAIPRPRADRDA